jgi:two-component system response regulator PilR (NtrC family)
VIQEKEFMRLGSVEVMKSDVRIVAATNADLAELVRKGLFREDLYYRLNVITIQLPPLRERTEDIPLLVRHFLDKFAKENEKSIYSVDPAAMSLLMDYRWPGNVRELENAIERAVVLSSGPVLTAELLPPQLRTQGRPTLEAATDWIAPATSFWEAVEAFEKSLIERALKSAGGVQKKAAELLQIKPTTLHEMMKRLGIHQELKDRTSPLAAPEITGSSG